MAPKTSFRDRLGGSKRSRGIIWLHFASFGSLLVPKMTPWRSPRGPKLPFWTKNDPEGVRKISFWIKIWPKLLPPKLRGLQNASFGIQNHCFYYKMSTRNPCIFTWFLKRSLSRSALFTYIWKARNRKTAFLLCRRREPREIHAFLHGFRRAQNCIPAF